MACGHIRRGHLGYTGRVDSPPGQLLWRSLQPFPRCAAVISDQRGTRAMSIEHVLAVVPLSNLEQADA